MVQQPRALRWQLGLFVVAARRYSGGALCPPRTSSPCTLSAPRHPLLCALRLCVPGLFLYIARSAATARRSAATNESAHSVQAIGNETVSSLAPLVIDYLKVSPSTIALALALAFALTLSVGLALALAPLHAQTPTPTVS